MKPPIGHVRLEQAGSALLWLLVIAIGGAQRSHVRLGFVTDHGADVVCPALLYATARQGRSLLRFVGLRPDRPAVIAAGIFGLSVGWEFGQKAHWIPGVYDPLDIVAYAAGVGVPFIIDRWLQRSSAARRSSHADRSPHAPSGS
jgi:hypothetical protein